MTPREFEEAAAAHYREQGYEVELGPYTRDWGIDAIAIKGTNRVAIQAKMYGGSTRLVSREQVMQLHGAAAYFGCTRAVIATDGSVAPDARLVADKLKIAILDLARPVRSARKARIKHEPSEFDGIWTRYIMPLASRTLSREDGSSNEIVAVDWGGVTRMTSGHNRQHLPIEIFRLAIDRILLCGWISRDEINQHFPQRGSSGIVLILRQVPLFEWTANPTGLRLKVRR